MKRIVSKNKFVLKNTKIASLYLKNNKLYFHYSFNWEDKKIFVKSFIS